MARRSSFHNVALGEVHYNSFLRVLTRRFERSPSSGGSASRVEEILKTSLSSMSAVGYPLVCRRAVAIARGVVAVVVKRSKKSIPRKIDT